VTKEFKIDVKDSDTIDTRSVAEVSVDKEGKFRLKMYCKDNALVQLGKHLGMFVEKHEITGKDGGPVKVEHDLSKLSEAELDALESLLSKAAEGST